MNVVNLYSGGGIMTYGLPAINVLAAVDYSKTALACYSMNHRGAKTIQADLNDGRPEDILDDCGIRKRVDVLHASPPCQCWSSARKEEGHASYKHDDRRPLLFKPVEYVRLLRPEFVIIENVRGLVDLRPGPEWLEVLLQMLEEEGYQVPPFAWRCSHSRNQKKRLGKIEDERGYWLLNSADYGVPSVRRRVFIVARRGKGSFPPPPSPTHGDPLDERASKKLRPWLTARDAIGHLTEKEALNQGLVRISPSRTELVKGIKSGEFFDDAPEGSYRKRTPWDRPFPPLLANPNAGKISLIHPVQDRLISVREHLIGMGADGYQFPAFMRAAARYEVSGNGIPPAMYAAVLEALTR